MTRSTTRRRGIRRPRIIAIVSQKGGVGKTTVAMNLAAVTYDRLAKTLPGMPAVGKSPVCVISTDPQASGGFWVAQTADNGPGLPFDHRQILDLDELATLTDSDYQYIFIDTPGSLADDLILQRVLDIADEVLVPMLTEVLCFEPTARTIEHVLKPRNIPYNVVINLHDGRDGERDLADTVTFVLKNQWNLLNSVIRRYRLHTRAALEGRVCTQYGRSRGAVEAKGDFLELALEMNLGKKAAA